MPTICVKLEPTEVRMIHDKYTRRATEIMRKGGFPTVIASIGATRSVVILDGEDQDKVRRAAEWLATGHRDAKVIYVRTDSDGATWVGADPQRPAIPRTVPDDEQNRYNNFLSPAFRILPGEEFGNRLVFLIALTA